MTMNTQKTLADYEREINNEEPTTFEYKQERIRKLNEIVSKAMLAPVSDKGCHSCAHCRNTQCAAREMAEIPPEVMTRTYGCKKWYERDFIPF